MVAAGITDLHQCLCRGIDDEPTLQVEAEFWFVKFLRRAILLCVKYLLVIVQCDIRLPEAKFWRGDKSGIDAIRRDPDDRS